MPVQGKAMVLPNVLAAAWAAARTFFGQRMLYSDAFGTWEVGQKRRLMVLSIWVVVKTMVPFWVP